VPLKERTHSLLEAWAWQSCLCIYIYHEQTDVDANVDVDVDVDAVADVVRLGVEKLIKLALIIILN